MYKIIFLMIGFFFLPVLNYASAAKSDQRKGRVVTFFDSSTARDTFSEEKMLREIFSPECFDSLIEDKLKSLKSNFSILPDEKTLRKIFSPERFDYHMKRTKKRFGSEILRLPSQEELIEIFNEQEYGPLVHSTHIIDMLQSQRKYPIAIVVDIEIALYQYAVSGGNIKLLLIMEKNKQSLIGRIWNACLDS